MTDLLSDRRVQFVSKPIVPPYRDGTKCLVRDLCRNYQRVIPEVMGTAEGAPGLGERAVVHPVYPQDGAYAPGLTQNVRAASWLAFHCRADIWHYVFAPNPRSSQVGRALERLRRVPILQTIASTPRDFSEPDKLLFGHVVVAQSHWTKDRFEEAFERAGKSPPRLEVLFPPCPAVERPSEEALEKARLDVGVADDAPLFVYPGDLEFSGGGDFAVDFGHQLSARQPGAMTVLAYRQKTDAAAKRAQELALRADAASVRLVPDVADIHALVAAATAVIFPVEDLYGKVDLPIVLLESLALGIPVLALDQGSLSDLTGAVRLSGELDVWVARAERLIQEPEWARAVAREGTEATETVFSAASIAARYEDLYEDLLDRGLKS